MSETPEFKATDVINHRYADASVLTRMLISFEIPKKQIKLQATEEKGFEMQLPRKLTDVRSISTKRQQIENADHREIKKEMQMILEEFEAEHVRRKIARQRSANSA
ncbi:hypothetical protein CFIO01_05321 [Colletotrichum fioriniae PJ7]|uniref:Uncharacterized protein n=1 Tax=Colletotrichum fioriniae PJ7 TaxID=1445577 RepID=A0A010QG22_9PEZI|nr:hypothetical protein CFIO01_05321 [Colletotrichum fioriniae PJ7]